MKEYSRSERIGEQMQRELALLIQRELKDPRVGMVTVSGVKVSRDLSTARVYVTVLDEGEAATVLQVLNRAAGFLRRELGRHMAMRTLPALRFEYDESVKRGADLSRLIERAVDEDKSKD